GPMTPTDPPPHDAGERRPPTAPGPTPNGFTGAEPVFPAEAPPGAFAAAHAPPSWDHPGDLPPPPPRPPHPGFWWALLWVVLFIVVSQGSLLFVALATILGKAFATQNPEAFLARFSDPPFQSSAEFAWLLTPALFAAQLFSILLGWL